MTDFRRDLFLWLAASVLVLTCLWGPRVLAEQERSSDVVEIAADFAGDGMDRPYSAGYMPSVSDDSARIVLPLRPVEPEAAPAAIQVAVDLGDPSSPFIFQNYDLRVPLEAAPGGEEELYLIDLDLPLEQLRQGGRYPVAFTCSGRYGQETFSQTFTVFVTVPDTLPPEEPEPSGDPDPVGGEGGGYSAPEGGGSGGGDGSQPAPEPTPAPQPKLMIVSQSVSPSPVQAGSAFTLSVTFTNTSTSAAVSNLLLSLEGDGADVYAADGQSQAYYAAVKAGETFSASVSMMSAPEADPGIKKVLIHAGYDGPQGTSYTQDESVAVEIVQPVRFAVDEPDIPASLPAGETWNLAVNVMNLGRAPIRNVKAQVEAPGIRTQNTLFLGNLESGTARKGTLSAFVGPKSEEAGQARYGETQGVLTVSCEDELGAEYVQEFPFALGIEAPVIRSDRQEAEPEEEEEPAFPWQLSLLIAGGLAAAALFFWLRSRRREKEWDEDE